VQSASVMVMKKPLATSSPQPVSPQDSSDPSGSRLRKPSGPQNGSNSDASAIQLPPSDAVGSMLSPDPCRWRSGVCRAAITAARRPYASACAGLFAIDINVKILVVDFLVGAVGADRGDGVLNMSRSSVSPLRMAMPAPSPLITGSGSVCRAACSRRLHRTSHSVSTITSSITASMRPESMSSLYSSGGRVELQLGRSQLLFGIVGVGGRGLRAEHLAGKPASVASVIGLSLGTAMAGGVL
jgi:hypothetical protein